MTTNPFEKLEGLDCNTGSKPGMTFREAIIYYAKSNPEMIADVLEGLRNSFQDAQNLIDNESMDAIDSLVLKLNDRMRNGNKIILIHVVVDMLERIVQQHRKPKDLVDKK